MGVFKVSFKSLLPPPLQNSKFHSKQSRCTQQNTQRKRVPAKLTVPSREADTQCDFYAMATTESFWIASKAKSAQKN